MTVRPFPCGWRNKMTGAVYWNVCTQTGRNGQDVMVERILQTEFLVDKCTATQRHVGMQASFIDDASDTIVRNGTSSLDSSCKDSSKDQRILESEAPPRTPSCLEGPCHFSDLSADFPRAHRGGRTATTQPSTVPSGTKDTDDQRIPQSYRSRDFVILNRTSPRTRTDFELLYNLLDRWRVRETETAASVPVSEPSRTTAQFTGLILSKEVELLRAIDSLKTSVKTSRRERSYRKFLDDLSRPVVWRNRRGEPILVDTPRARRARSFRDRFNLLSRDDQSTEERVEVLCQLRRDIELHTCKVSDSVVQLVDQEIDLLARDVDECKLNWLRSRLRLAFLMFVRDALATEFEDVSVISWYPRSRKICRSCGRLLPIEKFPEGKIRRSSSCNYCLYVQARTVPRVVYGPYECLLRDVRRSEARMRCYSSIAFVIDSRIIYHLVNDIWHGKSAISENDRLSELRFVRFHRDVEWSPWNCLLLTVTEALVHRRVDEPEKFYGPMILQKFHTRNLQAKVQFESVANVARSRERKKSRD
ncbi:IQ and ubiquitin-like domain-containing protein [Dufourea novaeangliae]|uniref:IQ and ubiquitin-like domain-containing protein n=1 Tax=Dufourea novaeangliae TaxID=178035 RepID=A0A154PGB6_DUFNO|nr:IQ and ubiquitin-like domain-containing protein [Dufourea novaeangliae]